jgi:long-chain acyl-CoA synthetase
MTSQPWVDSYPPGVPATVTVPELLVPGLLTQARQRYPDRTALWFLGRRIRYRTLRRDVRRFAAGLAAHGVGVGDRVSLVLPPSPQQVIALLAIQRLGAVAVLHNHVAPAGRLSEQMSQAASVGAVVVDHVYPRVKAFREAAGLGFTVVTALADYQPPGLKAASRVFGLVQSDVVEEWMSASLPPDPQSLGFMDLVRTPRGAVRQARLPSSAPAAIVFSADGATGEPATVTLTHHNLVAAATSVAAWLRLESRAGERILTLTPPFAAFGLLTTVLCVRLAATQVLTPRFEPVSVRTVARESDASVLAAVPAAVQTLADIPYPDAPLGPVRLAVTGPENWDAEEQHRVRARLGVPVVRLWGPAESSGVALGTPLGGPLSSWTAAAESAHGRAELEGLGANAMAGLPLPGVQARVIDRELRPVPPGTPGQLQIRGPMVAEAALPVAGPGRRGSTDTGSSRRWLSTARRAQMSASGWVRPGPEDGELSRARHRVVSGGLEVSAPEVERCLTACPGVSDAYVAAVSHPYRGHALRAYVVADPSGTFAASRVYEQLRQSLEPHMIPREVLLVDRLPDEHV